MRTHWSDRERLNPELYKLNCNETLDTHLNKEINKFIQGLDCDDITQYPDIKGAYLAVAEIMNCDPYKILLTSGADGAIYSVLQSVRPDSLNINIPTYGMVSVYCNMLGINVKSYMYRKHSNRFIPTPIDNTNATYIATPENTTGVIYNIKTVRELCERCEMVIIDDTYNNYISEHNKLIDEYNNLFLIKSFSKTSGVAGLRIGCVLTCIDNIDKLYQFRPMFEINSVACQYLKYIKNNLSILDKTRENIRAGKELLESYLVSKKYTVYETYGNYVLVDYDPQLYDNLRKTAYIKKLTIDSNEYIRVTSASTDIIENIINEI